MSGPTQSEAPPPAGSDLEGEPAAPTSTEVDLAALSSGGQKLPVLSEDELDDMRQYLALRDTHYDALDALLLSQLAEHPLFGPLIQAMPEEMRVERNRLSHALEHAAVAGDWTPYLVDLRQQGLQYAVMGVPYSAWSEVVALVRKAMTDIVRDTLDDLDTALAVTRGMGLFFDIGMAEIAGSYIDALIVQAREAEAEKARSDRLTRVNEELHEFAYAASHDLRTPLRGIRHLATWIAEDLGDQCPPDVQEHVELLSQQVGRMEGLLEGLLDYARIGRDHVEVESVSLTDLTDEVRSLLTSDRPVELTASDDLPTLQTAIAPLRQVLGNLVGNAVRHHDGALAKVHVSAIDQGAFIEVVVTDDGPGIPEHLRARIFHMFQTLRPRDETGGLGMGLAISRRHVNGVGGRLWVEPVAGGRGCAFRFTWPKQWPSNGALEAGGA